MNLSSGQGGIEPLFVAHHGPQHIDSPTGEGDHGLAVPLAFSPLAIVEGPTRLVVAQAGEGGLVEDLLEQLVAAAHPAVVTDPLARVVGGRDEPRVGGASRSALEKARRSPTATRNSAPRISPMPPED